MSDFNRVKKIFFSGFVFLIFVFSSCSSIYRVYNDEELELLAISQNNFSEVKFFKIVDSYTAEELTGTAYNNGGVIVGQKDGVDRMLFVPKRASQDIFIIDQSFNFNIDDIYYELEILENEDGEKLYNDPSNDYGGLSISVSPYDNIKNNHSQLTFDTPVFFIVTTDDLVFYIGYVNGEIFIFNSTYDIIN